MARRLRRNTDTNSLESRQKEERGACTTKYTTYGTVIIHIYSSPAHGPPRPPPTSAWPAVHSNSTEFSANESRGAVGGEIEGWIWRKKGRLGNHDNTAKRGWMTTRTREERRRWKPLYNKSDGGPSGSLQMHQQPVKRQNCGNNRLIHVISRVPHQAWDQSPEESKTFHFMTVQAFKNEKNELFS